MQNVVKLGSSLNYIQVCSSTALFTFSKEFEGDAQRCWTSCAAYWTHRLTIINPLFVKQGDICWSLNTITTVFCILKCSWCMESSFPPVYESYFWRTVEIIYIYILWMQLPILWICLPQSKSGRLGSSDHAVVQTLWSHFWPQFSKKIYINY